VVLSGAFEHKKKPKRFFIQENKGHFRQREKSTCLKPHEKGEKIILSRADNYIALNKQRTLCHTIMRKFMLHDALFHSKKGCHGELIILFRKKAGKGN
jgi:hypothetical protein